MTATMDHASLAARNQRTGLVVMAVVLGMVGLSFAAVPLYRLFCQVTGFGGPAQGVVVAAPLGMQPVPGRMVQVQFNTDVDRGLDWSFIPEDRRVTLNVGAEGFTAFVAENTGTDAITGTAVYNVLPIKAAPYFHKTQCFCFGEQTLQPGQKVTMPVIFYLDPAFAQDPNMDDVQSITLSYTFYQTGTAELERAIEAFQP